MALPENLSVLEVGESFEGGEIASENHKTKKEHR
jgi:hypothetical protein